MTKTKAKSKKVEEPEKVDAKSSEELEEAGEAAEDLAKAVAGTAKETLSQAKKVVPATGAKSTKSTPKVAPKEPYEYGKCSVLITIQMFPDDGHEEGREVVVSGRTHDDVPVIRFMREKGLGRLPKSIRDVLGELEKSMPERKLAWMQSKEKKKSSRVSTSQPPAKKEQPTLFDTTKGAKKK